MNTFSNFAKTFTSLEIFDSISPKRCGILFVKDYSLTPKCSYREMINEQILMKYSLNEVKYFTRYSLLKTRYFLLLTCYFFSRYSCIFFSEADPEMSTKQIFIRPTGPMSYIAKIFDNWAVKCSFFRSLTYYNITLYKN